MSPRSRPPRSATLATLAVVVAVVAGVLIVPRLAAPAPAGPALASPTAVVPSALDPVAAVATPTPAALPSAASSSPVVPSPTATSTPATTPSAAPAATPAPVETPSAPIASPAPSSATLTPALASRLQARLDALRAKAGIPGASVAIRFPDGTVWTGTSGLADVATGEPVTPETGFAIASISKTFTAALVLALAEDGRIALDAPVRSYLPDLDISHRITVRQLLDHTSGLMDYFFAPKIDRALQRDHDATWTSERALRYVQAPYFKPGKGWHYSNTNYLVLGLLAERVGGRSLAEQLRDRFLAPLGLSHTIEQVGESPVGPMAHGYRFAKAGVGAKPIDLTGDDPRIPFTSVVTAARGAGSLASTPTDLVQWVQALYEGTALAPASVAAMIADASAPATHTATIPYGLGVQAIRIDGRRTLGHSGRLLGFQSVVRWLPDQRVAVAVTTNQSRSDPGRIARALLRVVLGKPTPPA